MQNIFLHCRITYFIYYCPSSTLNLKVIAKKIVCVSKHKVYMNYVIEVWRALINQQWAGFIGFKFYSNIKRQSRKTWRRILDSIGADREHRESLASCTHTRTEGHTEARHNKSHKDKHTRTHARTHTNTQEASPKTAPSVSLSPPQGEVKEWWPLSERASGEDWPQPARRATQGSQRHSANISSGG